MKMNGNKTYAQRDDIVKSGTGHFSANICTDSVSEVIFVDKETVQEIHKDIHVTNDPTTI